ncbi:hypothetical protein BC937DRAFT_93175 [Endogone sp. FLAS-F59071]|nr:hypothetical protein BC937DRAFT_93175 [Endogone sp. FLAS-F59071]|eukprot:RUS14901.1 hypothetical protein BC937DRAFT_93175 [Endogone sp. FLAS-F59071]
MSSTAPPSLATTIASLSLPTCIFNSPCPFATTLTDLSAIFSSPETGAVTTRTSLIDGFPHNDNIHKWASYSGGTINCLGYSPHTLDEYLEWIEQLLSQEEFNKPIFVSITGTAPEVGECIDRIRARQFAIRDRGISSYRNVAIEVNLSCPNIAHKPPPSYDTPSLREYLAIIASRVLPTDPEPPIVGLKLAPFLYDTQYADLTSLLLEFARPLHSHPISFLTAINTIGGGLVVDVATEAPALGPAGSFGGLGGPAVHAVALGNVRRLYLLTQKHSALRSIDIIGVGGADSGEAVFRFLLCGAKAVMGASALLEEGVGVYKRIAGELKDVMHKKNYGNIDEFRGNLREG